MDVIPESPERPTRCPDLVTGLEALTIQSTSNTLPCEHVAKPSNNQGSVGSDRLALQAYFLLLLIMAMCKHLRGPEEQSR